MTKSWEKGKSVKVFARRPSQCIYRMIQDFLTHGISLYMIFVHGFRPILIFWFFCPYWRWWGYAAINVQLPCIFGGRNNNVLDKFW